MSRCCVERKAGKYEKQGWAEARTEQNEDGTYSVISAEHANGHALPITHLHAGTLDEAAQAIVRWKKQHNAHCWQRELERLRKAAA